MRICRQTYRFVHLLSFWLFCTAAHNAHADTSAYKCTDRGKTTYSQLPCKEGEAKLVEVNSNTPSESAIQDAAKAQKLRLAESKKMQSVRERAQAKDDSKNRAIAKRLESEQKQCEVQKQKAKWAKEDLNRTQPKGEMKAQAKLKRANERAALTCK